MKARTFNSKEDFQSFVNTEFLPTLQALNPNFRVGYNFKHDYICEISLQQGFQHQVYTVWRDVNTLEAVYCQGVLPKKQGKDIPREAPPKDVNLRGENND